MSKIEELKAKAKAEGENNLEMYSDYLYDIAKTDGQRKTLDLLVFLCNELDLYCELVDIFAAMVNAEWIPEVK